MWRRDDMPWTYHRLISFTMKLSVTEVVFTLLCENSDTQEEIEARLPGNEWGYFRPYFELHNSNMEDLYRHDAAYIPLSKAREVNSLLDGYSHHFCTEGACYDYPHLLSLGLEDSSDRTVILAAHKQEQLKTSDNPDTRMMIYKALDLYKDLDNEQLKPSRTGPAALQRMRIVQDVVPYVLVGRDGLFTEMSNSWREVWGVNWNVGATPWTMSPGFQPCGTPSQEKATLMIQQCIIRGSNTFDWVHTHVATGVNYHCRIQLLDAAEHGVIGRMVGARGRKCPLSELQGRQIEEENADLPKTHSRFG